MVKGKIHSYHTLTAIDGPGLRFLLFLQGCPLRCMYCHNPDSWKQEDFQEERTAEEILEMFDKYRKICSGGITISGGEPLMQKDFLSKLVHLFSKENIHTAIDTAGSIPLNDSMQLIEDTSLFFTFSLFIQNFSLSLSANCAEILVHCENSVTFFL